ncbi:hypothetical protein NKG05_09255 [Oerskovia sp. M15]
MLFLHSSLPVLQLTPEGLGARLAKVFGGQDIQFESEGFNRAWRVESSDLRFAHDVLHPRIMHRLLEPDFARRNLRIEGDAILGWTGGRTVEDNVFPLLSRLVVVADAIPDHVWLDRGALPPRRQGTRRALRRRGDAGSLTRRSWAGAPRYDARTFRRPTASRTRPSGPVAWPSGRAVRPPQPKGQHVRRHHRLDRHRRHRRHRSDRPVLGGRAVQRLRPAAEPGAGVVASDRRRAAPAP